MLHILVQRKAVAKKERIAMMNGLILHAYRVGKGLKISGKILETFHEKSSWGILEKKFFFGINWKLGVI